MKKYINMFVISIPLTLFLSGPIVDLIFINKTEISFEYFNRIVFIITVFILSIFFIKLNNSIKEVSPIKNEKINCLIFYILTLATIFWVSTFISHDKGILLLNMFLVNIIITVILSGLLTVLLGVLLKK